MTEDKNLDLDAALYQVLESRGLLGPLLINGICKVCLYEHDIAPCWTECLDATLNALSALELEWDRYTLDDDGWRVEVWPKSQGSEGWSVSVRLPDSTPQSLATAIVQATLHLLREEDASCPD